MTAKNFTDVVSFTRDAGKTRTNAAGLIVGVDFSSTSNTVTTGSKTFTLAADANVNRDWATGSAVRAVDQVGGGVLVGTVTSYTPSTQSLVINVATVTGSGTGTNWRIGSLEMTRDVTSGAVNSEAAATNLITFSEQFENAVWAKTGSTASVNTFLAPNGSVHMDKLTEDTTNGAHQFSQGATYVSGSTYTLSVYARAAERATLKVNVGGSAAFGVAATVFFNLTNGVGTLATGTAAFTSTALPNGVYLLTVTATATASAASNVVIGLVSGGLDAYTGDGTSGIFVWGAQLELNAPTSYIPTTTAQVTRNADSFALTSSALTAIRQGQGTLYVEAESADVGPAQKRAIRLSGLTGDIRLAKRGVGNFSGFTKMLEVDNDLYFGVSAGNSQRDTGKEIGSFQTNNTNNVSGNLVTITGTNNAFAYDGVSQILYNTFSEERAFSKNLLSAQDIGFGGNQINGGTYTGTRFIFSAGTAGRVFLSTDGLTYRRINTPVIAQPTNEVTSGTVGGTNRVVIVGNGGFIATSDDQGETWTSRVSGTAQIIKGVTLGAGLFVACDQGTATNIRTSPDGITWTARTTAAAQGQNDVAYNGTNLFVSVGAAGTIQTSPDAITWTARTSGTTQILFGVHFANGLWVAVGGAGTIITSSDGITWTTRTSGQVASLLTVNYFNNLFVVGNSSGGTASIITSANGIDWVARTAPVVSNIFGIAVSPTRLVATGSNGAVTTSEDGTTYTSRTNNSVAINGMAFGNGVFVSVGNASGGSGYIATIDAAGNYTRRVSGTNQNLQNCRFLGGVFYTTQNSSGGNVFRSTDGSIWTTAATFGSGKNDVAYNGSNLYVTVGGNGTYATSSDGVTWGAQSQITGEGATTLNQVVFAIGLFVTVGSNGKIFTSPNGTTWTLRTSGTTQQLNSVMYSVRDQLWYAAGAAGTMLFSSDAINWQSVQNAGFVSVDNNGLQANPMLPLWTNGRNKIGISYKDNQVIASINGVSKTDLLATIPTLTSVVLGENLNGLIYKTQVFPDAISEVELNALTGL